MENKKTLQRENLNGEINYLQLNSKNKDIWDLYRGIHEFKKSYQPRADFIKDEKGDQLSDFHGISYSWKKRLSIIECTWGWWR